MKTTFILIVVFFLFTINSVQSRINEMAIKDVIAPDPVSRLDPTGEIMALVGDAAQLIRLKGETAFNDFRISGSRWRQEETYIFVLDPWGNMLVHNDPELEGKNQMDLKDINGKLIIRGLLDAANAIPDKPEGWYHYQWPVPGGLLPRWKSSYVQKVKAPSGKSYIVGSGTYNDRMEREFVVDLVKKAVNEIEKHGKAAFKLFHDPTGPFLAKDAYIFVITMEGVEIVNPAFPSIEGRNNLDVRDPQGKFLTREIIKVVQTSGTGWVDYMWPKPGESVSTQKSAYVSRAILDGKPVAVGCGVYLGDAPKTIASANKMTAEQLMTLVREGAAVLEEKGEKAYPEFREKGSRWFHDDTYFFVVTMDGIQRFHATEPAREGLNVITHKDVLGRPFGKMSLETAGSSSGEGWIHYMWPEPGELFPKWKSTFVKRVTFPSGKQYYIGSAIYQLQMDKAFIEDVVNRASALVAEHGTGAFDLLRDKTGPFIFMDTYVFVDNAEGVELVNSAQPSLQGKNLINERDLNGKRVVRDYIDAAMQKGSAWVEYNWYRPGGNEPAQKHTFVRKVLHGNETYIVGSGFYLADDGQKTGEVRKESWKTIEKEEMSKSLYRQAINGEKGTLAQFSAKAGVRIARHAHPSEEYFMVTSGSVKYIVEDREYIIIPGEVLVTPSNVPHALEVLEETVWVNFFTPGREDWLRGEDQYLRYSEKSNPDFFKPNKPYDMTIQEQAYVLEKNYTGTEVKKATPGPVFTVVKDTAPEIISLVKEAAELIRVKGEAAFDEFRIAGSRWRMGDTYIFVLDPSGNMLVHADSQMEGKNQLDLKDINGKPIIRGLLGAVTSLPDKREGWYHYQWPVPGGLLPRWKSSYVRLVHTPTGKSFIVGSGVYNDRMEREFVVDLVKDAVGQIEKFGTASFRLFHDPKGPFKAKDAYVFVVNEQGVDLVNPGFPNLEGRNIMDLKDTRGKYLIREMFQVVGATGSGWVDYMWPKPGESVSTRKSTYVTKAKMGDQSVLVGCGVYLADAPKEIALTKKMEASELMTLVREAAVIFENNGEKAYPQFRMKGTKWFRDDTYFFVWNMEGVRVFHAAEPAGEGQNVSRLMDIHDRPIGQMMLNAASTGAKEGWVHYMYPEPGDIFPTWKSTFIKGVTFPDGKPYLIGCGIYQMELNKSFVEDVVDRAAKLIAKQGKQAFSQLRDKTGPFVFMDTYVFVQDIQGNELVNAAQPSLEGRNLLELKDLTGMEVVKAQLAALKNVESAWLDCYWFKPGDNLPALKRTYVRKVRFGSETYVVGSGIYLPGDEKKPAEIQKIAWNDVENVKFSEEVSRQLINGQKGTVARFAVKAGAGVGRHQHDNEEYVLALSGIMKFVFDDRDVLLKKGEVLIIPANVPHFIEVTEDAEFFDFFIPVRSDWMRGEDQYLRKEN